MVVEGGYSVQGAGGGTLRKVGKGIAAASKWNRKASFEALVKLVPWTDPVLQM